MGDSQERATLLRLRKRSGKAASTAAVKPVPVEDGSQDWLGRSLKQLFDNIASEPIPQRIVDKLKELEQKG